MCGLHYDRKLPSCPFCNEPNNHQIARALSDATGYVAEESDPA